MLPIKKNIWSCGRSKIKSRKTWLDIISNVTNDCYLLLPQIVCKFDTMKTDKEIEKQKAATETKIVKVKGKKIAIGKFGKFGSVKDVRC